MGEAHVSTPGLLRPLRQWRRDLYAAAPDGPVLLVGGDDATHAVLTGVWDHVTRLDLAADNVTLAAEDDAFAVVVAPDALSRASDPEAVLAELRRVSSNHVVVAAPHRLVSRVGNLLRGNHLDSLGAAPSGHNQWTTPAFLRLASRFGGVRDSKLPLGWTAAWIVRN